MRAFEVATLLPTGTQFVANVQGSPGSLIRCGADRLAFRTSSNQVFIVHSALVPAKGLPTSNLGVTQQVAQDFTAPVDTIRFWMTVTNRGPADASNVLVAIKPPDALLSCDLKIPQGISTKDGGNYLCNLGTVEAGQSREILLSCLITNTMFYTNQASISSSSPDPDLSDNVSRSTIHGRFHMRADCFRVFAVDACDLAYDRSRQRLYASLVSTNAIGQVIWLDPETGVVAGAIPVGPSPGRMAISDDDNYLYVSGFGTPHIQRVNLNSGKVDLEFDVPISHPLCSLEVIPGQPSALVVSCAEYSGAVVAILDDGIARQNTLWNNFKLIAISDDATFLYGYDNSTTGGDSPDMFQAAITMDGLQVVSGGPSDTPFGSNVDLDFAAGRLFFGRGGVFDPNGWVTEPAFPDATWLNPEVEINVMAQRVIYVYGGNYPDSPVQLTFFNLITHEALPPITMPGFFSASDLRQCGADRLAFRSGSSIIMARSSAIAAADLAVRGYAAPNVCVAGEPVQLHLTISNAGPYAVADVLLDDALPDSFDILSATSSQGSVTLSPNALRARLGSLTANGVAVIDVVLTANGQALGWLTNSAQVWTPDLSDPIPSNNRLEQPLLVEDGPRIVSLTPNQSGSVEFIVHGAICRSYTIETSTNLLEWRPLTTFICASDNQRLSVPLDHSLAAAFYRLQSVLHPRLPYLALYASSGLPSEPTLLEITAPPGYLYAVEASSDLTHWIETTNFVGTECITRLIAPIQTASDRRFFRVKAYEPP